MQRWNFYYFFVANELCEVNGTAVELSYCMGLYKIQDFLKTFLLCFIEAC